MGWTDALRASYIQISASTPFGTTSETTREGATPAYCIRSPFCCSVRLAAPRLVNAGVDREVRGWGKASDHAPTWITDQGRSQTLTVVPAIVVLQDVSRRPPPSLAITAAPIWHRPTPNPSRLLSCMTKRSGSPCPRPSEQGRELYRDACAIGHGGFPVLYR